MNKHKKSKKCKNVKWHSVTEGKQSITQYNIR
jgi:hypothetical protein